MFDVKFLAAISNLSVKAKEKDGAIRRTCKLTLACEYGATVADGLGAEGRRVLKALRKGDITEVVLPIDAVVSKLTLDCNTGNPVLASRCTIPAVKGIRAKAKAATEEGMPPTVKLEFEFEFHEEAWAFLGRNCSSYADVELVQLQTTLAFPKGVD